MPSTTEGTATEQISGERLAVRRFTVLVGGGRAFTCTSGRCSLGTHSSNDVVLADATVSRFHCELIAEDDGLRIRDLGSRNGTVVDGTRVVDAFVNHGAAVRLGLTELRIDIGDERAQVPASRRDRMGTLVGRSVAMRTLFSVLERAAASDATVLIEGESGTGKEAAAAAIHHHGARADHPFVVIDCGAIAESLVESELFGHERGAFTGAVETRPGAFEQADTGTVFLDEIGELPLAMQPKLLRVLEQREVRRVGGERPRRIDVRVIAATNRDLRRAVNQGTFREDLYYRLAVLTVTTPPLRTCLADLPTIVDDLLTRLGATGDERARILHPTSLARFRARSWPGNVRELRNAVERTLRLESTWPSRDEAPASTSPLPYAVQRRQALDEFERRYLEELLERHEGRVADAAHEAGVDRVYIYRLMRQHGLSKGRRGGAR